MNIYRKQCLIGVPWNQIKSENIESLYLLSALKETVQIYYKKACSVMEEAWIQHSTDIFVDNIFIKPILGNGLFLYSLKEVRKPEVSWCFQGA